MSGRRALVAGYAPPQPDRDSGSRRLMDLLRNLREDGWHVTFAATAPIEESRHRAALEAMGIAVIHADPAGLARLLGPLDPDLALLVFWPTAELLLPVIRRAAPRARVVVDSVDLHLLRQSRAVTGHAGTAGLLDGSWGEQAAAELNVYRAADGVLTVSAKEATLIDDLLGVPGRAAVVPDTERVPVTSPPFGDRRGVLFVGSFRHAPNVEAVGTLCREIVPRLDPGLLREHPVSVVGNGMGSEVADLGRGHLAIRMVGWVPVVEPWLSGARVNVLPLRSGAGTKRKLLAALMAGTPSVSTSVGIEGFDVEPGRDVLVEDDPARFAGAIARLLTDPEAWTAIASRGRERALAGHGPLVARDALRGALASVLARAPQPPMLPDISVSDHQRRMEVQYAGYRATVLRASAPGTSSAASIGHTGALGHRRSP